MSNTLTSLIRCKGTSRWKVFDDDQKEYSTFSDVPETLRRHFVETVFPPPNLADEEELHLEYCMRFLPHHQDTGGFFVAVLRKLTENDHFSNPIHQKHFVQNDHGVLEPCKKPKFTGRNEDPFVFMNSNDSIFESIKLKRNIPFCRDHFGFDQTFDNFQLLARSTGDCKKANIYLVNKLVRNFIINNENKIKIINAGNRIFGRTASKSDVCQFRLTQEGIAVLYPLIRKRLVSISPANMIDLLKSKEGCLFASITEESRQALMNLPEGSLVLYCVDGDLEIRVAGWRGKASIALHVDKENKLHYLHLMNQWESNDTAECDKSIEANLHTVATDTSPES